MIEAKRNDLDYGFSQLAAQLIALDQWQRSPSPEQQPMLWGAVTTGEVWKVGRLERTSKQVTEAINLYRVPEDIATILNGLIQTLKRAS